jgi:hypothetical protein
VPYPPLRYSQSGRHQPRRATIFCRTAITPLTHCLTPGVHFSYEEFLKGLAQQSGIATPTREDLARVDRKRKSKGSNEEWVNPHDPDARITRMKDGGTHLAHKAEHAVDMETGAVVAVTLQGA